MPVDTEDFPRHPHSSLNLVEDSKDGTFSFLRPTIATFTHKSNQDNQFVWKARDQRKGRHETNAAPSGKSREAPTLTHKLGRMLVIEYWNISWWVAVSFTIGSVVWVINGFYAFLPFANSRFAISIDGIGWSAWVGATIFEFGSLLLIWEAWNRGETAQFGWGIERALHGHYKSHVENGITEIDETEQSEKNAATNGDASNSQSPLVEHHKLKHWIWFTSNTKYWRELGFLAGVIQLCAASIFWIAGWTSLPVIQNKISDNIGLMNGVFWTPQVIGGCGFIISSALYMLETQKRWYKPEPLELGWHIGFWNCIGGVGFTICGAFGYSTQHWALYQSSLSTFWGGWAFLIGSVIQWYEAVNPVPN